MIKSFDPAQLSTRYKAEKRFKTLGLMAVLFAASFVLILVFDIVNKSIPAFSEHKVRLTFTLDKATVLPSSDDFRLADTETPLMQSLMKTFPDVSSRGDRKRLGLLLTNGSGEDIRFEMMKNNALMGQTLTRDVLLSSHADSYFKGEMGKVIRETITQLPPLNANKSYILIKDNKASLVKADTQLQGQGKLITIDSLEDNRKINNLQAIWLETLKHEGRVTSGFNMRFFTSNDSRDPALAGVKGAFLGSLLTVSITLLISLPLGVAAAIYLQEFAPKNRFTDILEVNINNLAAVPSIVFGLLGLAIFLNVFQLPRSAPLVGGLVLALMVLPTIIIAARTAMAAVPPSIKQAALGVGASDFQAVFHHVVPLALPGIMTGTIIGISRALGETAPLLMIGMVAFILDTPQSVFDPATVLPVQIYLWSDLPESGFVARTAAAILVLLGVLFSLNALAVYLRNKFERRW